MNIILFDSEAEAEFIPAADHRAKHVRKVLGLGVGDSLFVGVVNGHRGKATIVSDGEPGITLLVDWEPRPPITYPIRLLIGLPRPHTARKILFDAACLGVERLDFFESQKGEPSYRKSKLWASDEWRERLRLGAEQAFATQLPQVEHFGTLQAALEADPLPGLALDVYEGEGPLSRFCPKRLEPTQLAIGSERGWSADERNVLRGHGFRLVGLGERVLRTETACVTAVSVVLAAANCL
ncbi:MAG: RsmE family RNA methyltransferase [Verrucomicrobiota bacterium]